MSTFSFKKSNRIISLTAGVLSVAFVLLIVGPAFLFAGPLTNVPVVNLPPTSPSDYDEAVGNGGGQDTTYDAAVANFQATSYAPPGAAGSDEAKTAAEKLKSAADETAAQNQKNKAQELAATFSCGLTNPKGCIAALMDIAMWMSARTLWVAGVLLNITLDYTLNLNTLLEKMPVVDIGWKVLRDIANIVFIFITLWCGISITLGIGDDGKKAWGYLAQMVLVALFINFSLFIAKAVVDVSNVASLHFYSLIVEPGHEKDYDGGLSEAFLYGLKLSTIYNSKQIGAGSGFDASKNSLIGSAGSTLPKLSFANVILIGFFGSLFIIVTAWVFFAAAIMFIYRAITLIILMMLSPLAFVGLILPGASGMAHAWWSKLWSQAFFAPLYLALAYVVVRTINTPGFQGALANSATQDGATFAAAITGTGTNSIAIVFNFIILIGLMVGCLIVAQSLGAKGSDMAMAGFEKIKGTVQGGMVSVAGASARGLIKAPSVGIQASGNVGRGISSLANSKLLNNKYLGNFNKTKLGGKMSAAGAALQQSKIMSNVRSVTDKAKYLDPRMAEERLGQSKFGNTWIGQAARGMTTGALANVQIGNKSLEEAYEEDKHRESAQLGIKERNHAIEASGTAAEARKNVDNATVEQADLTAIKAAGGPVAAAAAYDTKIAAGTVDPPADLEAIKAKGGAAKVAAAYEAKITAGKTLTSDEDKQNTLAQKHKDKSTEEFDTVIQSAKDEKRQADTARKLGAMSPVDFDTMIKNAEENTQAFQKALINAKDKISEALGKMSNEEFLHLMPRDQLKNSELMNINVLGEDKYNALMEDEHFSEGEKEEFTHARYGSIQNESKDYRKKQDEWNKNQVQYTADDAEWEKQEALVAVLTPKETLDKNRADAEIEKARAELTAALDLFEKALPSDKAATKALVDIEQKNYDHWATKRKDVDDAVEGRRVLAKLKNTAGNKTLNGKVLKKPESPKWKDRDLYNGLRNMRNVRELENIAKFMPELLEQERFMSTLSQGLVDRFRESTKVSSSQKTKARLNKSFYIGETHDLIDGDDAAEMRAAEEVDPIAVARRRTAINKQLSENFEEFEAQLDFKVEVNAAGKMEVVMEKDATGKNKLDISGKPIPVKDPNRRIRHETGMRLMPEMTGHKADDELNKLPGAFRNLFGVRRHMGRGATKQFASRDEGDDKRPLVAFMLDQLKQSLQGHGKFTSENAETLKWMMNDRDGKGFANYDQLDSKYTTLMEIAKSIYGLGEQATQSQYTKADALREMSKLAGSTLTYEQARKLFKISGTKKDYS